MTENIKNVQDDYLKILKKLKTSKKEHSEEDLALGDILNDSNILFTQISNTGELKLDAKVTEIHSDLFLKRFTKNVQNRKIDINKFIKDVNDNKLNNFFNKVNSLNRSCSFAKFIDFDFFKIKKERKPIERIQKVEKDVTTLNNQGNVEEDVCVFLLILETKLQEYDKLPFYECVVDPESYDKTVENIFNVAIAIRSKRIMFKCEGDEIFLTKYKEKKGEFNCHVIFDITYEKYQTLINGKSLLDY